MHNIKKLIDVFLLVTLTSCSRSIDATTTLLFQTSADNEKDGVNSSETDAIAPLPAETPAPIDLTIYPNLDQARQDGFHLVAGHAPFTVSYSCEVSGGVGELTFEWDFDGDGVADSNDPIPAPVTYDSSGEYFASLTVSDQSGQVATQEQRMVLIGEPESPEWCYGVADHLNKPFGLYTSPAQRVVGADLIADAGIQAVRLDYPWVNVEPNQDDVFVWTDYDEVTEVISDAGLEIVATLGLTPKWASSGNLNSDDFGDWFFAPPKNPQDYADYVYHVVDRYKSDVHYWEIWNEPNLSLYFRNPDPKIYTEMLKGAYLAAKYADPRSTILAGSLANDESEYIPQYTWIPPEAFLESMYDNGAKGFFDAISRHPYNGGPDDFRGAFSYTRTQLENIRTVLDAHGDTNIPIWITEYGVSRDTYSEIVQASFLKDSLEFLFDSGLVDVVMWYNFRSTKNHTAWGDGLGIVSYDLVPLPAYEAYQQFISEHPCP